MWQAKSGPQGRSVPTDTAGSDRCSQLFQFPFSLRLGAFVHVLPRYAHPNRSMT